MNATFDNIQAIIFDLGGVLLNLDYQLTEKAFAALEIPGFEQHFSQLKQTSLFDDLETGRISASDFFDALRQETGASISNDQITEAWNAMLLDFPRRRLQILQQLQLRYQLFLLSNTNEIHETAFNLIFEALMGRGDRLAAYFDKVYFSHRLGMRKPNEDIFLHILSENKLLPDETLFIDDSPQHIETAKRLGIQTILLQKGMTIEDHIFLPKIKTHA